MNPILDEIAAFRIMHACPKNSDGSCQKCRFVAEIERQRSEIDRLSLENRSLAADLATARHIIHCTRELADWVIQ